MGRVSNNFSLKIFSLAVAVVLYLFVSAESMTPIEVEFPIEYRTQEGVMVVGDSPTRIRTTLQGPWANFHSFAIESLIPVRVDLTKVSGATTIRHSISSRDIEPPGGMKVVAFSPSEWTIDIDIKVERLVEVKVDLVGRSLPGYEIVNVAVEPAQVRVVGPHRSFEALPFVRTLPVDVSQRETDLETRVDLRAPPSSLVLRQKNVLLNIEIQEEVVGRTFRDIPVQINNPPAGSPVKEPVITFVLKGPRRIVDKIEQDTLEAFVDLADEVKTRKTEFEKVVQFRGLPERTSVSKPLPSVKIKLLSN